MELSGGVRVRGALAERREPSSTQKDWAVAMGDGEGDSHDGRWLSKTAM